MPFNNIPVNGWPQIKDLEKLDALAKQIENMPSYTSTDRAFLDEWEIKLPDMEDDVSNLETTKANQITIAPTFSAEDEYSVGDLLYYNGLSYRCVNAHMGAWDAADFIPTTIALELANKTVIDYSTTEQNTGKKWIDGKDIYVKSFGSEGAIGASPISISHGISNLDKIIKKEGTVYYGSSYHAISIDYPEAGTSTVYSIVNSENIVIDCGSAYSGSNAITGYNVTLYYTKSTT